MKPVTRRRLLLSLALLIAICLWFALPSALNATGLALILVDPPPFNQKVDCIVSLGGNQYCRREEHAAELYAQSYSSQLVISTTEWGKHNESSNGIKAAMVASGVPSTNITMVLDGINTRIEAEKITSLMRERGWKSAIIVTSAYHSRRAAYTFRKAAPDFSFYSMPTSAVSTEWRPEGWWRRRGDCWRTVRELVAWINTLANGWK